jgi:hypothetical protein
MQQRSSGVRLLPWFACPKLPALQVEMPDNCLVFCSVNLVRIVPNMHAVAGETSTFAGTMHALLSVRGMAF